VLESAPDLRVTSCSRCQKGPNPVVEINATTMTEFGPLAFDPSALQPTASMNQLRTQLQRLKQTQHSGTLFVCGSAVLERVSAMTEAMMRSEDKQLELFCFDNCKTHCTSSRLHLGSRLILAMLFPGNFTSFSEPFELLSKKPRNRRKKDTNPSPESSKQDMSTPMLQVPSSITMVPSLLIPGSTQPLFTAPVETAATQTKKDEQPQKTQAAAVVDTSLMAAVAEEIESSKMDGDGKEPNMHASPKQKKARFPDMPS